jgi:hypothetical protein
VTFAECRRLAEQSQFRLETHFQDRLWLALMSPRVDRRTMRIAVCAPTELEAANGAVAQLVAVMGCRD